MQDKRLGLKLNGNRRVTGILRGFDPFMYTPLSLLSVSYIRNLVLDQSVEFSAKNEQREMGMVVSVGFCVCVCARLLAPCVYKVTTILMGEL